MATKRKPSKSFRVFAKDGSHASVTEMPNRGNGNIFLTLPTLKEAQEALEGWLKTNMPCGMGARAHIEEYFEHSGDHFCVAEYKAKANAWEKVYERK